MYHLDIETKIMTVEEEVWSGIYQEQEAVLNAERIRLGQLQSAVHEARSTYCEQVLRGRESVSGNRGHLLPLEGGVENYQQTEPSSETRVCEKQLAALREEVTRLENSASLWAEQKRLDAEPQDGDSFSRVRAALQLEREMCDKLDVEIKEAMGCYQLPDAVDQHHLAGGWEWGGTRHQQAPSAPLLVQPVQPRQVKPVVPASKPRFTPKKPTAYLQIRR